MSPILLKKLLTALFCLCLAFSLKAQIQVIPNADSMLHWNGYWVKVVIPGANFQQGDQPEIRMGMVMTPTNRWYWHRQDAPPYGRPISPQAYNVLGPDTIAFVYQFNASSGVRHMADLSVVHNGITYRKDSAFFAGSFRYHNSYANFMQDSIQLRPLQGYPGEVLDVEITGRGTNFEQTSPVAEQEPWHNANGLRVDFHNSPAVITYHDPVQVFSKTRMRATITIPLNTPPGDYDYYLFTAHDGVKVANNGFRVLAGTPSNTGHIRGRVYRDFNRNCAIDTNDRGLAGIILETNPGSSLAVTDQNGDYDLYVPFGIYTVSQRPQEWVDRICPPLQSAPVTVSRDLSIRDSVNFADTLPAYRDVSVAAASNIARPGFRFHYAGKVANNGNATMNPTLLAVVPALLDSVLATPPPARTVGDSLYWDLTLPEQGQFNFTINSRIPADVNLLGREMTAKFSLSIPSPDREPGNDRFDVWNRIGGSFDPNDKAVEPAGGLTETDSVLTYTIRFQNTGTDTAFTVVVRDTLSQNLDVASIKTLVASHPYSFRLKGTRNAEWRFDNILLVDSNRNEEKSHGLVKFSINRKKGLSIGTPISNQAHIYFDFNPPVATNLVQNNIVSVRETVQSGSKNQNTQCRIVPNPLRSSGRLVLLGEPARGQAILTVTDALGKIIYRKTGLSGKDFTFGDALHPGVYFVRVSEHGSTLAKGRFVAE